MIKDLPEKLHTLRVKHALSQRQVAERLGISPSVVSGYETGERTPSTEVLLAISYLYNCSVDYLLGRKSAEPKNTLDLSALTDRQAQAVISLIEAFKGE